MNGFDIPVVLILFKRKDTVLQILNVIRKVAPQKIYLLSDQGRDNEEIKIVQDVRRAVEEAIDWDCEVVKNYADVNRGVHANIGMGARWVFEYEEHAIFLEDDNLPEETFFMYCKELLDQYKDDERILWVCGTNYLGEYQPQNDVSYMFTQHLLPCGWASWANKFNQFYDYNLNFADDEFIMEEIRHSYNDQRLYKQQCESILMEKIRKDSDIRFGSWDYHMLLSIRANHLLGISPVKNQIKNIGVDEFSIHGGNSMTKIMTKRFCGMSSYPLQFPIKHPKTVLIDYNYEKKISNIILMPFRSRFKVGIVNIIKKMFGVSKLESIHSIFNNRN